jgi:hypothetical protein
MTMQRGPLDALRELCSIFPEFERWWNEEEAEDSLVDGVHLELTNHRVLMEFLGYFAKRHGSFTEQQWRSFGAWVNEAVGVDDDLENAVSTCFLEHCRALRLNRILAPYLSPQAKRKSRP